MTGRLLKPGGQGSSGSGSGSGTGGGDPYTPVDDTPDDNDGLAFDFPGSGEGGEWSDKDFEDVDTIIADVTALQNRGDVKSKDDIKRYLNGLMEDNGIKLAQYQALKLYYGIE